MKGFLCKKIKGVIIQRILERYIDIQNCVMIMRKINKQRKLILREYERWSKADSAKLALCSPEFVRLSMTGCIN